MEAKITAWIARDKNGTINIFRTKPSRFGGMESQYLGEHFCPATPDYYWGEFKTESKQIDIPENLFPEIKWEDKEPTKVELTINVHE